MHSPSGEESVWRDTESREERAERRQQEAWLPLALQNLLGHTRPSLEHVGVTSLTLTCQVFPHLWILELAVSTAWN